MAGDDVSPFLVKRDHFTVPSLLIAYKLPSIALMYIVPSGAMTGDDSITPPVIKLNFSVPSGFRA